MDPLSFSLPKGLIVALGRDIILLHKRDFQQDAKTCISMLHPPLKVIEPENIPQHGPCVITVNHYHREGFSAEWLAIANASVVPAKMHWIMTGEFTYPGRWYEHLGAIGSRWLLKRIAYVYGFSTMPPMPPRPMDVEARAAAVRAVLEYVRHRKDAVIGLAPEGYDPPAGTLTRPASGLGRFGLLLSKAGLRFAPVGAYEEDGVFQIHFGESYELNVSGNLPAEDKDHQASQIIMENIARLLPMHLRGEFIEKT